MKMKVALLFLLLVLCFTGCGQGGTPQEAAPELTAKEGESANGFLWENNFSEITITGYEGASNQLNIPKTINGKPVTLIAPDAFSGFKAMTSVTIPDTVTCIANAFQTCTSLVSVQLGNGVTDLSYAFVNCISLKEIYLPESVETAEMAFQGCSSLEKVTISEGVVNLDGAFAACTSLKEIQIPSTVETMKSTFSACTSLEDVILAEGITLLEDTFTFCTALKEIRIPKTVESLHSTFRGCTKLKNIELPEGLKSMEFTFSECSSLKEVKIPQGVTRMLGTFEKCVSLKSITIPENVQISNDISHILHGCTSLETLVLPNSHKDSVMLFDLHNLKKITMSEESYENTLTFGEDLYWSVCEDSSESWYQQLINTDISKGYRYYTEEITIGENTYREISRDSDNNPVEPYYIKTEDGYTEREHRYCLALLGEEKVILCHTYEKNYYFPMYLYPLQDEDWSYIYDEEGNHVYPELSMTEIEINGKMVPVQGYLW